MLHNTGIMSHTISDRVDSKRRRPCRGFVHWLRTAAGMAVRLIFGLRLVPPALLVLCFIACKTGKAPFSQNKAVRIVGVPTEIHHTHGGTAALLSQIPIQIENDRSTPVKVRIATPLRFLSGHSCDTDSLIRHSELQLRGLQMADSGELNSEEQLMIPARSVRIVHVFFNGVTVYQSFCDIYAIEADVHFDDTIVTTRAPIHVIREEPWNPVD